jgi:hypothetical protein
MTEEHLSIRCVRLITGEDLIAEYSELEDGVRLINPLMVLLIPSQADNKMHLQLVPFLGYAQEKQFEFSSASVMTVFVPNGLLEDEYRKVFGKVVLARSMPILGADGMQQF